VVGVLAAIVGANLAGVSTVGLSDGPTLGRLPEQFVRGAAAIIEEGALGFAIATLARSQLAGIGAGIALYFGETFAGIFLPDAVKFLPFHVATAAVSTGSRGGSFGGGGQPVPAVDMNAAIVLVAVWLVGSLFVAALVTERAEISG
jgi:hypothetical protein